MPLPSPHTLPIQATEAVISLSTEDTFIQDNNTLSSSEADNLSSVLTITPAVQIVTSPSVQTVTSPSVQTVTSQFKLSQFQLKSLFHRAINHLQLW